MHPSGVAHALHFSKALKFSQIRKKIRIKLKIKLIMNFTKPKGLETYI